MLSPVEKILLARAHRVVEWLDEAVIAFLKTHDANMPTLEDLAPLGWETVARILWMKHDFARAKLFFRRDTVKCANRDCPSNCCLLNFNYQCGHAVFTVANASPPAFGAETVIFVMNVWCSICRLNPFGTTTSFTFYPCQRSCEGMVRVTRNVLIEEMFYEGPYQQNLLQLRTTNNLDISRPGQG